jgi:hypothetical protein
MAPLTPRLLRRGPEIFAVISLLGFVGLLLYGNNLDRFLTATPSSILLWRITVCCLTVGFGSVIFWRWLTGAESKEAMPGAG